MLSYQWILLPTLRVAHGVNWNGHELSKHLEDLEKLDETLLWAIARMYALKQRQKSFYDAKVKTKELKLGNLVLAYTLKQRASKLKKQEMDPYACLYKWCPASSKPRW